MAMASAGSLAMRGTVGPILPLVGVSLSARAKCLLLAAAGIIGAAVLYNVDPRNPGTYPICPFFGLTGCFCPGCGTLRALHLLLNGNPLAAMGYNPFAVLSLPFIVYSFLTGALRAFALPAPSPVFVRAGWIWGLLGAVLTFWALRNVPFAPFTVLAP